MKILLNSTAVLPSPPERYGGIELIVYLLADGLSQLGHDVILAGAPGSKAPNTKVRVVNNINPGEQLMSNVIPSRLAPIIEAVNPDIISDHDHTKTLTLWAREKKYPVIPTAHNLGIPQYTDKDMCMTSLSQTHRTWLKEHYGIDSVVIYNGLDTSQFHLCKPKVRNNRLLYVARPHPEKGQLQFINFCLNNNLLADVVTGNIPMDNRTYLLEIARACIFRGPVQYIGEVPMEIKNRMLSEAKAFVFFQQVSEAFGLAPVEAILCGTPSIVLDIGGPSETIENNKTGFVIPIERDVNGKEIYEPYGAGWYTLKYDEAKVKEAIESCATLDNKEIQAHARKKFDHIKMAEKYVKVYERVLNGEKW